MFIRLPSRLHMSHVSLPLSSHSSILLSLIASLFLLAVIRAALLFLRARTSSSPEKQTLVHEQQKNVEQQSSASSSESSKSSWGLGFFTWENLPTLPVSLEVNENDMKGRGVGFVAPQRPPAQSWQPGRRSGPAFERPVPTMYQTDVPMSMAKMIMSRHTFRKPTQRPPPRPPRTGLQMQYTRRSASMV
ncbi:hypothetical protein AN958_05785 [Leucoagaricus sp. SymC.cos]|nr:hypothetical protein AN958_05785 [Leucoagaricus sp. SymC.cos]